MLWNASTQTATVQMTSQGALEQARSLVAGTKTPLRVTYALVSYSANELEALATRLLADQASWAGASGIGGGYDPVSNRVLLQVDPAAPGADIQIAAIRKLNDPRVSLQILKSVGGVVESRTADWAPWTTGAAIDSANYSCTLGWAWKLWSNSQVVGSTARHCTDLVWSNNGVYVGTVFQSTPAADSALMNGSSYSPSVFVGPAATADIRPVVGVDTSWAYGDLVAMSGRTTGLNVAAVQLPTYTLPACAGAYAGLSGVLMQTHVTAGGDSGGPWLTTLSGSGDAIAHGQHFGRGCLAGYAGSFFVKLNSISAAQHASILVQ